MSSAIVYIDMDDTLCDYRGAFERAIAARPGMTYPQSQPGFFEHLEPVDQALESMEWLSADRRFDPYILTAPSTHNPLSYTEKRRWVEKHFGLAFCERLIICARKDLLKGHYLIDDYIRGRGQERFEGELIHFGSQQFPDWPAVIAYLDGHPPGAYGALRKA